MHGCANVWVLIYQLSKVRRKFGYDRGKTFPIISFFAIVGRNGDEFRLAPISRTGAGVEEIRFGAGVCPFDRLPSKLWWE